MVIKTILSVLSLFVMLSCSMTGKKDIKQQPGMCAKLPMAADGIVRLSKIEVYPEYLEEYMKYATIAQENGTQGRVIVQFVVNKDGSIVDAKVVRSVDPYLDKEALRVINTMPKWKPGMQRGKPVRVKFTVPVMFRLQ